MASCSSSLYGNLRGIREAGQVSSPSPPTSSSSSRSSLILPGYVKDALGHPHPMPLRRPRLAGPRRAPRGRAAHGAGLFIVMRPFANGGSSLTGLEAISNGVSVFRRPEASQRPPYPGDHELDPGLPGARGHLAGPLRPTPSPTPTGSPYGRLPGRQGRLRARGRSASSSSTSSSWPPCSSSTPAATPASTASPTWPASWPGTRSCPASSPGAATAWPSPTGSWCSRRWPIALILVFRATLDGLVALYAIGVFTGFYLAGAGMVKHHLDPQGGPLAAQRGDQRVLGVPHRSPSSSSSPSPSSTEGAWVVVIMVPPRTGASCGSTASTRTRPSSSRWGRPGPPRRRSSGATWSSYSSTASTWRRPGPSSTPGPSPPTTCGPSTSTSTPRWPRELEEEWSRLGLSRLPLDIIECPDRRLGRATLELVADAVADGDTECTVLLPRRTFATGWQRFLHDRTADKIAAGGEPGAPRERHHRPLPGERLVGRAQPPPAGGERDGGRRQRRDPVRRRPRA